ncbi:hypothetical protein S7711_10714 [Stachybotrys chartarum IBT 7711]|uniref:Uncharacterized protein n=1 Tax=Stachybotrys chartarum (strain CBS 109288 / IBT 7711) TaxID=1280523 RepID=A0A084AXZ0_STACB|nr:hypothetical protein S7711_10714 [Stachybotrys chartarum IBT 7711]KFA46869.1 hypothetical protein S40293_10970 [Stachybotrys chartarum IBT 40293]KFA72577.1 hypothetical protein S40288_11176 [Stachybotrys chartarum IBT 40288]
MPLRPNAPTPWARAGPEPQTSFASWRKQHLQSRDTAQQDKNGYDLPSHGITRELNPNTCGQGLNRSGRGADLSSSLPWRAHVYRFPATAFDDFLSSRGRLRPSLAA